MKTQVMFVLMLLASISVVAPRANAQRTKLAVPYDFMAAGRLLHAGTYTVTRQPVGPGRALFLKNIEDNEAVFLLPTTFESALSNWTTLRFEQVGQIHILTGVRIPDTIYTFAPGTKAERTALKESAASSAGQ